MAGQETTGNRDGNFARCRDGDTKLKTASGTAVQAFTNGIDRAMNQNSLVKRSIVFFLVPNFSMIAFATAIEPLRIANRMLGYDAYQWRLTSVDGKPVTASNGVECAVNASLEDERRYLQREQRPSMVFVCSGVHVEEFRNKSVFAWLREEYNRGVAVGGLCTGAHILAAAGLLSGRRCAIHWENLPGFSEAFPKAEVYADLFEVDSNLYTCAGGTASLDMMLKLIGDDFDANLVNKICEQALTDRVRSPQDRQRLPLRAPRHPEFKSSHHHRNDGSQPFRAAGAHQRGAYDRPLAPSGGAPVPAGNGPFACPLLSRNPPRPRTPSPAAILHACRGSCCRLRLRFSVAFFQMLPRTLQAFATTGAR
ncbi:ARAC family Transcriptional regulator [Brucella sp. NVSL 07-0026]|nr:ARAC family Transcriptional regulator [Brucella sp. NVSL 07-0026]